MTWEELEVSKATGVGEQVWSQAKRCGTLHEPGVALLPGDLLTQGVPMEASEVREEKGTWALSLNRSLLSGPQLSVHKVRDLDE